LSFNISKTKLENISLFSLGSKKFGYGHYNRIKNLIFILEKKKINFFHYSFGINYTNKNKFLKKIDTEISRGRKIILDFTNDIFLDANTILKLRKIIIKHKYAKIYIIDSPTKKNLSTILNINFTKTLIPFEVTADVKKRLLKINKKKIGIKYFIYPYINLKKKKKIYDITLSFGGSDNYKGTVYVLKLLEYLKVKSNVLVVTGKYFNNNYKEKIRLLCQNNKFKIISFTQNHSNILNSSKILITNSGLTKYEGVLHGLKVLVFSDTREIQKIDQTFTSKTNQFHFSYSKNFKKDQLKLKYLLKKKFTFNRLDKNILMTNNRQIKNFFLND